LKTLLFIFPSILNFAKIIKANHSSVANKMTDLRPLFRGSWYIAGAPFLKEDSPLITDTTSQEYIDLIENLISSSHIKKAVFVYNASDNQFIKKFSGIMEVEREYSIKHETIKKYALIGTPYRGYLFSYHRLN